MTHSTPPDAATLLAADQRDAERFRRGEWVYPIWDARHPEYDSSQRRHRARALWQTLEIRLATHCAPDFVARAKFLLRSAHVSTHDPLKVAYHQSTEKAARDIQSRIKPGKFVVFVFGDLATGEEVAELASLWRELHAPYQPTVQFATSADDIERVFTQGPRSCMSYPAGDFQSPEHPVRVYAHPENHIAVAYIERDGRITARALASTQTKLYSRVYGDESGLRAALAALGYTQSRYALHGETLLRIEHQGRLVAPYIDASATGPQGAHLYDCGNHLRIDIDGGDLCAESTNGLLDADEDRPACEHCGCAMHEDDVCSVRVFDGDTEQWCADCVDDSTYRCEYTGDMTADRVPSVEVHRTWTASLGAHNTIQVSADYADLCAFFCDHSEEYFDSDYFNSLPHADGSVICEVFAELYETDEDGNLCGSPYPSADARAAAAERAAQLELSI